MNKHSFIEEIHKQTDYDLDTCKKIDNILQNNFFISKQSKDKIIDIFMNEITINNKEANNIYSTCVNIFNREIKNEIKE